MKKKRVAGLLILAPLFLLAACGGGSSALPITANWYATTTTSRTDYSAEKLEYAVTFTPPSVPGDYYVNYDDGVYTTEFVSLSYEYEDGTKANVYRYKTDLSISGHYTYQGTTGETFHDYVRSEVLFRLAADNLVPIRSSKEIYSTNPVASPSQDRLSSAVHIRYDVRYNTAHSVSDPLQKAVVTVSLPDETDETKKNGVPTEVGIDEGGSFFDNEEILFAIRGLSMTEVAKFSTIDPQTNAVTGVTFATAPEATAFTPTSLTVKGEGEVTEEIAAYKLLFYYDISQSGPERTAFYAASTSSENNRFRNVLLQLQDPIPNGYGTLVYTLRSAEFAN